MFKVKVIAVGKCKEKWLKAALFEYEERMRGRLTIEWCLALDDKALLQLSLKEKNLIALDLQGEMWNSLEFTKKWMAIGSRISFVIGGPEGLPKEIIQKEPLRWSLSPLTFTNQIVRLLLVEQLYRSLEIEKGSGYHK